VAGVRHGDVVIVTLGSVREIAAQLTQDILDASSTRPRRVLDASSTRPRCVHDAVDALDSR
jgi:hypothetical protein